MKRDIAPFGLRLPPDLRLKLENEASYAHHSLTAEILARLERSFEHPPAGKERVHRTGESPPADYIQLADLDRAMLAVFRRLAPEKQLALLSLFK